MNVIAHTVIDNRRENAMLKNDVCPSLVLAGTLVCDAYDRLYQPCDRQIHECCTSDNHGQCLLRRSAYRDRSQTATG